MLKRLIVGSLLIAVCSLPVWAEVMDRVAAFVDDTAITLSELERTFERDAKTVPGITRGEVLNTMINRILLLRDAKKLRIDLQDEAPAIREYIDLKVRAFVIIPETDIEGFYERHKAEFKGRKLPAVRDEIEAFLREKEVNERLKRHIEKLRQGSYIKIINTP